MRISPKSITILCLLLFVGPIVIIAKGKPNVIIVITDDQGTGDLACMGNPFIKTPNIEKL
jgi:hypothetical protein